MPTDNYGQQYDVTSRGTNDQGNNWDHRVSENGNHGYHYSNSDGGYYYQNPDGSKYYNSGDGYSRYTSSNGTTRENFNAKK